MTRLFLSTGVAALMLASLGAGQKDASTLFQAGEAKAIVHGDLEAAIALYQGVVEEAGSDRALTARALIRIAESYDKLGDSRAQAVYERLIRDFADRDEARAAKARIVSLSRSAGDRSGQTTPPSWVPPPSVSIFSKLSPDGRLLPYLEDRRSGIALMLRDLAAGTARQLAAPSVGALEDAQYAVHSAFSRDGQQLAYAWRVRRRNIYQLRLVPIAGTVDPAPRVLLDNDDVNWLAPYDWTPDGASIAVVLQRQDRTGAIGMISTRDGSFQQLRSVAWDAVSNMAISPDGTFLAFDRRTEDRARDVLILAIDGSRETPVVSFRADDTLVGWTPDGGRLLFLSDRSGSVDLWSIPIVSGRPAGEAEPLRSNVGRFWPVGVTQGGAVVGAVTPPGGSQLYVSDFEFGTAHADGRGAVDEHAGIGFVEWSHDGTRLAMVSQLLGARPLSPMSAEAHPVKVMVRTVATNEVVALPADFQYVSNMEWTPDDRSLVIAGEDRQGRTGIFRVDAGSGRVVPIVLTPGEQPTIPVRWSAVIGTHLYYQRNVIATQTARLVEHDLGTGAEREILPWAPRFDDGPAHSRPVRTIFGITADRQVLYATRTRPAAEASLRLHSIVDGTDRELLRTSAPSRLMFLERVGDRPEALVVVNNPASRSGELFRVPLDGSGPAASVAATPNLEPFRVLGIPGTNRIYLAKREKANEPMEVWTLAETGVLTPLGRTLDVVLDTTRPLIEISPERSRMAYVSRFRPPARSLELMVFENLFAAGDRKK